MTYLAEVPAGNDGEFGPHSTAQILTFKYVGGMSIPKIAQFYANVGTIISKRYLCRRLTKHLEVFHQEKQQLYTVGLGCGSSQQIDDTTTRVNGRNWYTQIMCGPLYTAFFTTERNNRLTILAVLRNFESRSFVVNEETFDVLENLKIPKRLLALRHEHEAVIQQETKISPQRQ
ncbi:MAG: hypothetical protein GY801_48385 [bacterium]|nr:hypothetical protein [bacterium]